jgi:type VI secretion system secreted protein VgrG
MNNPKPLALFFLKWEGGLSRDLNDSASKYMCPTPYNGHYYHTNMGITYATWVGTFGKYKNMRFLEMSVDDWTVIMKQKYWDAVKGDQMPYQCAADVLTSWAWGSGVGEAGLQMQRMLNNHFGANLVRDGKIGPKTIEVISKIDPVEFFQKACETRESFFRYISDKANGKTEKQRIAYEKNKHNLKGWLNRLGSFKTKFHPQV